MTNRGPTPEGRTGSEGRLWVDLEHPKPVPVADRYTYWTIAPPRLSESCEYWVRQIELGWLPNRRISTYGYDTSAAWYGVYVWEYLHVIYPLVESKREAIA